jgi:hypothetical protein
MPSGSPFALQGDAKEGGKKQQVPNRIRGGRGWDSG